LTTAAIYARYSSALQSESSIDAQLAACKSFCAQRGYDIAQTYIDRIESASTTTRPQFQRMLADAEARKFNIVVTHKLDRFSRSVVDVLLLMERFTEWGVQYTSATEPFDYTTAAGRMFLTQLAALAEWYRGNLIFEIAKGKHQRAVSGKVNFSTPPFGYSRVKGAIVPNEHAEDVRWACEAYASGQYTYRQIADEFNTRGLTTTRGGRWTVENVREMIQNPFYAGWVSERGLKDTKAKSGVRQRVPRAQKKLHPGTHEPIISQELYEACQAMRAQRYKEVSRKPKRVERYLLGGIAYCSHCGRKLYAGAWINGLYANYTCVSPRYNLPCSSVRHSISEKAIVPLIEAKIAQIRLGHTWDSAALEATSQVARTDYRRRQKALQNELQRLKTLFLKGHIDEDYYDAEFARLQTELGQLEKPVDVPQAIEHLSRLIELWEYADTTERATILHTLLEKVVIDLDQKTIVDWQPRRDFVALWPGALGVSSTSEMVTTGIDTPVDSKHKRRKKQV
jgi:site-specific DNA recombinase